MFLYSVVVPVFPFSLVSRIHVAEEDTQHWMSILLSVYGAALLVGAPVFGFFADQLQDRRTPLLIGLVALTGATIVLCLATSLTVLIIGRVLQGLSASITWVSQTSHHIYELD
jgi:MFS family permease